MHVKGMPMMPVGPAERPRRFFRAELPVTLILSAMCFRCQRYLHVFERGGAPVPAGRPVGCGIELARSSVAALNIVNNGLTQSGSR